jgi:uncharacterized membrane protein YkoI
MVKFKQAFMIGLYFVLFQILISGSVSAAKKITPEEAKVIAIETVDLEEVGPITSIQLEDEEGILVYAVEFTKDGIETDVKINAETGEVVKIESDLTETGEEAEEI